MKHLLSLVPMLFLMGADCSKDCGEELCNGEDDDCDGVVDNGLPVLPYYNDSDGDGYAANDEDLFYDCELPPSGTFDRGDCDDSKAEVYPGGTEVCDGLDNDCNGQIDEGVSITLYTDADGDAWGSTAFAGCDPEDPEAAAQGGDCDDSNSRINPDAEEECDSIDNNCDGQIDEDLTAVTYYTDGDNDTYGDPATARTSCDLSEEGVLVGGDCDDNDPTIHPGASDQEGDGVDSDCDGVDCTTETWGSMTFGLCSVSGTVADAATQCALFGGELMSVRSAAEQYTVVEMMQQTGQQLVVVSLNDAATEGTFVWGDGSAATYTNWAEDEPNNNYDSGIGEDCVAIQAAYGYGWNDVSCEFAFTGVTAGCQRDRVDQPFQNLSGTHTFTFGQHTTGSTYDPRTDYDCRLLWSVAGTPSSSLCEGCTFAFDVVGTVSDDTEENGLPACVDANDTFTYTWAYAVQYDGTGVLMSEYYGYYYPFAYADLSGTEFSYSYGPDYYYSGSYEYAYYSSAYLNVY